MSYVRFTTGDIFASQCKTLVDPVNCVGVSGAGLAREFKRRFPESVASYEHAIRANHSDLWPGHPANYGLIENGKRIVFFPTKEHWRNRSKLEWIVDGIKELSGQVCDTPEYYLSIAIPALGCGLGGLRWDDVRPVIEQQAYVMKAHGVDVEVYEPK